MPFQVSGAEALAMQNLCRSHVPRQGSLNPALGFSAGCSLLYFQSQNTSGRHIWLAQKYFRMILLYFEQESYHFFFSFQPVSNWSGLAVQGRFQSCSTSLSKARLFSTCLALLKVSCKCHVLSENLNSQEKDLEIIWYLDTQHQEYCCERNTKL